MKNKKEIPFIWNKEVYEFINVIEKSRIGSFSENSSNIFSGIKNVSIEFSQKWFVKIFTPDYTSFKWNGERNHKAIPFNIGSNQVILNDLHIESRGSAFKTISNGFSSVNFKKNHKRYYKLVIPLDNGQKVKHHFILPQYSYRSENCYSSNNASSIFLSNGKEKEKIIIIFDENKEPNRLVILSSKRQYFNEFYEKMDAIRIALGYIANLAPGSRGYFFSYTTKEMKHYNSFTFKYLRPQIESPLHPLNSNPYSWNHIDRKEADRLYKILRPLNESEFSKLYYEINNNVELKSAILILIEASEKSIVLQPGVYSIVLEMLSNIIVNEEENKPITDRNDAKKFRESLHKVLKEHSIKRSFENIESLEKSIDNINKITNKEKLLKQFETLGISLSEIDKEIVNSRDSFLHGATPDIKKVNSILYKNDIDKCSLYATYSLYTLINLLIFKYIGFDNYVLNFPKIYEKSTGYLLDGEYYRKL